MRSGKMLAVLVLIVGLLAFLAGPAMADGLVPPPQLAGIEMPDYSGAAVRGVSLLFVVWGLVQLFKMAGIAGNGLRLVAFGLGTSLGILYLMATEGVPIGWAWFGVAIYGLGLGIVSFGVNDAIRDIIGAGVVAALARIGDEKGDSGGLVDAASDAVIRGRGG